MYLLTIISLTTSCSDIFKDTIEPKENPASKIIASGNLFLAGGLFGSQEFEQYALADSAIFFECGTLQSGRPRATSSFIIDLDQDQKDQLALSLLEIIGAASVHEKLLERDPENKTNQAILNVTTRDNKNARMALSIRQILRGKSELESKFAELISQFRRVIKSEKNVSDYCDNLHFFGLE